MKCNFFELDLIENKYESAALIFAHFPPNILSEYHKKISDLIVSNGILILEGFSKNHLKLSERNSNLGGPKNIDMLFSKESIKKDFLDFEILELEEKEIELSEGNFHNGTGSVIRFVGRKK